MAYGGYSDQVLDHFENPRNVGSFDPEDPAVGTGMVGAPVYGGAIKLQIRIDRSGVIEAVSFRAYGCGFTIASGSWVSEWARGKTVQEASVIDNVQIAEGLVLPPAKIACAVLAEQALKAAIDDYATKHNKV